MMDSKVFWSWGVESIEPLPNGVKFKVNGFKMSGIVKIIYDQNHDLFNVYFMPQDGEIEEHKGIYVDQLVDLIDEKVEYTGEDYKERVKETYLKKGM